MKRRVRKRIAMISSIFVMVSVMAPASATLSEEPQETPWRLSLTVRNRIGFLLYVLRR